MEVIKNLTATSDLPQQQAKGVDIIYTDSTRLKIKIEAPLLEHFVKSQKESYIEFPKGIKVWIFDNNEKVKLRLTSNYAIYHEQEELWEARDRVVAVNQEGDVLKTEQLFWNPKKEIIYTDKFAKVTDKQNEIQGEGFTANQDFSKMEFKKVTGIITITRNEKNTPD